MKRQESDQDKIAQSYQTAMREIRKIADQTLDQTLRDEIKARFLQSLPLNRVPGVVERYSYQRLYSMFFQDWLLLDYRPDRKTPTLAQLALDKSQGVLDHSLCQIMKNLTRTYVSLYRVLRLKDGRGRLENLIPPRTNYNIVTTAEGLMAGDILVTRLLPHPRGWLLYEPWILLLPSDEKSLVRSIVQAMKMEGYPPADAPLFCKEMAVTMLQAVNQEIIEIENELAQMVRQLPFCPRWEEAVLGDPEPVVRLLETNSGFFQIPGEEGRAFLLLNRDLPRLSWGYVLVESDRMVVGLPPRENIAGLLEMLVQATGETGKRLNFAHAQDERVYYYNERLVSDLTRLLRERPDLTDDLLLPRAVADSDEDQVRSDFFACLSFLIGGRLSIEENSITEE